MQSVFSSPTDQMRDRFLLFAWFSMDSRNGGRNGIKVHVHSKSEGRSSLEKRVCSGLVSG